MQKYGKWFYTNFEQSALYLFGILGDGVRAKTASGIEVRLTLHTHIHMHTHARTHSTHTVVALDMVSRGSTPKYYKYCPK